MQNNSEHAPAPEEAHVASGELAVSPAVYTPPTISDTIKTAVTTGLGYIPYIGGIVSALVGLLWPQSGQSVWDQIRQEVEKMIDQKINDAVFSLLKQKLAGLGAALQLYVQVVNANKRDLSTVRIQFIATNTLFVAAAPEFMNPSYEWTIGPLFAIFTQLHMSLLRDCVLHGGNWGWSATDHQVYVNLTRNKVAEYLGYMNQVLGNERTRLQKSAPTAPGQHKTDIHQYWQEFKEKEITLYDDFRLLLQHLDPISHPAPTQTIPFKDVYSRACGTADNWDSTASGWSSNGVTTPYGKPTAAFQSIYLEMFNYGPRVVDVSHSSGKGPLVNGTSRVDKYGVIAAPNPGVEKKTVTFPAPGSGKIFNIEKAIVRVGSIPLALTLVLDDGREYWMWDKHVVTGGQRYTAEVPGRMLTTLNMWTRSSFYNYNVGCIIFGFSRDPRAISPTVRRLLYVTAIGEPSDEVKSLITPDAALEAERSAYWRYIESRQ